MAGFGFGFGAPARSGRLFQFGAAPPGAQVAPSAAWTGIAGSGFAAAPVDPFRSTAKPAIRMVVPPKQFFTDTLLVGFAAAANDGGDLLDNMGLSHVRVHYEGSTFDIASPGYKTLKDANGVGHTYGPCWWVELKHDGRIGTARLYAEAVPRDATMQNRVIGPYSFNPAAQLHDRQVEIDETKPALAGARYPNWWDALTYLKAQNAQNPLITIRNTPVLEMTDQWTNAWDIAGYYNVVSDAPMRFAKAGYTTDTAAKMHPGRVPLHLSGRNITIDFEYVLQMETAADANTTNPHRNHWFDGINLTNSAGRDSLWRGGPPQFNLYLIRGRPWLTECAFSEVHCSGVDASLIRGCSFDRIGQDIVSGSWCVIGNSFTNHSTEYMNTDIPAFTVEYTGSASTATLSRSGGSEGYGGGVYTATWGSDTSIFNVGNGSEAYYTGASGHGYWFADVVGWLNTLPGWSATLLINPDRRACTGTLTGLKGQGFGGGGNAYTAADVKAGSVTVTSLHDKHGDWYQHATGNFENAICMGNRVEDCLVQMIFLSPIANGDSMDMVFFNNIFKVGEDRAWLSQIGRDNVIASHVVIAHNTFVDQGMWLRTDAPGATFDTYTLLANNVWRSASWGGTVDADPVIKDNHLQAGAADLAGSTGTSIGGDATSLFADAAGGNYDPAGALLTNLKAPVVRYDASGAARGSAAPPGALS